MIEWADWLRFGVRVLGLSPEAFWRLTPYELACLAPEIMNAQEPLNAQTLTTLMMQYPDKE